MARRKTTEFRSGRRPRIQSLPVALAAGRALNTSDTAHLFAMLWTAVGDSFIGCWDAKYHSGFWRPVTAIQNGGIDGNPDTVPDPTWMPLGITPNHPEYPAAHGCLTGA